MAGDKEVSGPDLREGIASTELAESAMLTGHVGEDAVLVARIGGEVVAVGATCTHYGGPLAEGLLVDDTVRCPWHHACFSLRTGEALRAPALNDLPRWDVEERAGRIRVTGRVHEGGGLTAARAAGTRRPRSAPESVVIVGGGAAGNAAAEKLRRLGYDGPIRVLDDDPDAPYDRPNLSKDYLAGTAPEEWIPLHPPDFYEKNGIERVRGRVESLDTGGRRVVLAGGKEISYAALLLATGAEPVRLPIPAEGARLFYLRSLADSRAIISAADGARTAVVLGASFIGLEVAASLRNRQLEVHVVAPEQLPLEKVVGEELGRFVRDVHEEHGVVFHLGHTAREIAGNTVVLDDGSRLEADLVVAGIGVRPRVALAERAGLDVDGGVRVNEFLQTSAEGVFAAGDIARFPDGRTGEPIRVEHWVVAERQGQVAAANILGEREPYHDAPFFWSQHYDAVIAYVGHAHDWDRIELDGDPRERDCTVTYLRGGRRLAVATIFRDDVSLRTEVEMERAAARVAG